MKKILVLLTLILIQFNLKSQSNLGCYYDSLMSQMICGSYTIQGDPDNICDDGVHLWVQYNPGSGVPFSTSLIQEAFGSTDSYKVVQSPYIFETQTNPISANINTDDIWGAVVNLPFKFCFFENKYDQIVIGANGQITFDITQAGQYNNWSTGSWPALPYNDAAVNNCILSPYHDIYPTAGGIITYSTEGVAPCRKFVITWNAIPMFSCTGMLATQQIVLTEGSYRIDINVPNKPLCSSWNSGKAYLGIQNSLGTIAYMAPGYNGTQWSATNESFSFIPIGNKNLNTNSTSITQGLYWVDSFSNNVIGFGDTLNYWPPSDTTIYVFWGDTALLNDPCFLNGIDTCINVCGKGFTCNSSNPYIRLHYIKPSVSFTYTMNSNCAGADVQFNSTSNLTTSLLWDFGDGSTDTSPNPFHTYLGAGPFVATLIGFGPGCNDTATQIITPTLSPVVANFTLSADSVCGPTPITSNNMSIGSNLQYTWIMGDGTIYNTMDITHSYLTPGNCTVILQITDSINNCKDTAFAAIYVDNDFQAKFTVSPSQLCVGQTVYTKDTFASNVLSFNYTFSTGDVFSNVHNPELRMTASGSYSIELTSTYPVCPIQTITETYEVYDYPVVKLVGPDEICTGRETITITDENNPNATYEWNTGATSNSIEVTKPDLYKVTVTNVVCETKAEKYIAPNLECVFIPNAFSPNGDGNNDFFHAVWYDDNDIGTFYMYVYNRYGQQVYFSDNKYDKGWNGTFKGTPCEVGTYMYVIHLVSNQGSKKEFRGDVTLLR